MSAGIGLVVKIAAETKQAVGDIRAVNSAIEGTGSATSGTNKLLGTLKNVGLPVLGAVAAGVGAAAAAMWEFGQAAIEDQREANKLARILETIPGITADMIDANEAWTTSTMLATHVMDTELREAVGKFTLQTKDLTEAQKYATAAANLATVTNTEYATVVDAVEKALAGKTRALMGVAPWLDANRDGTLDAAEAASILTDKTIEGAAAAAAAEDPWTTIKIVWDEIKESLGQWILPLFDRFAAWFKDPVNQKKIQEFITELGDMSSVLGTKLIPYLEDFMDWLGSERGQRDMREWAAAARDIAGGIKAIADMLGALKNAWDKLPAPLRDLLTSSNLIMLTGGGTGLGSGKSGTPAAGPSQFAAAPAGGISINFYGGVHTDPEGTARAIRASLTRSDWRNARQGAQLEPAW